METLADLASSVCLKQQGIFHSAWPSTCTLEEGPMGFPSWCFSIAGVPFPITTEATKSLTRAVDLLAHCLQDPAPVRLHHPSVPGPWCPLPFVLHASVPPLV